ncbi:serine/threonine-protein kinase ULK3-like isoform X1 [Actinia tenebrosa]|nr:serine/threonine-protein kinase ULK3-like isoform X1 [Actinia tenebrosa]
MEYCSGGDLSSFIQAKRRLPEWVARKFLRQLASALCFLHSHNIAHMDLKPHNLLLSSRYDPILKLADFGFAQYLHSDADSRNIRGSPLYMAPEMICHESYDASVDLWSVGVILYETLFGEAPFKSRTFSELEAKLRSSDPIHLPLGSKVSSNCQDLLLSLLQRDPKQRITFEAFFAHPFIDMEHMPSSSCLEKAADLVSQAVALDQDKEYKDAAKLYSQAMEYFLPAIEYEKDPVKKDALRKRVNEYMSRAEDLKQALKARTQRVPGKDYTSTPDQLLAQFSRSNPQLKDALHLAEIAEIRDEHGNFSGALQQYQVALHNLLPLLAAMPKGTYKDALRSEIDRYMRRAEELKLFLKLAGQQSQAQRVEQQEDPSNQSCVLQ